VKLVKLDNSFYRENFHLKEALDNEDEKWITGKVRGYGIVVIKINNLTFAVPLRTNIRHKASYIVVKSAKAGIRGKGLDFSKALLISKRSYILENEPFKIPPAEHMRLANKGTYIRGSFEKYVQKYIMAVKKRDQNILNSNIYRYTTLQNYHKELGC
jgi:protein AbiQ